MSDDDKPASNLPRFQSEELIGNLLSAMFPEGTSFALIALNRKHRPFIISTMINLPDVLHDIANGLDENKAAHNLKFYNVKNDDGE